MKRFLFIQSLPPQASITGQEGLDAILMGSAFTDCALLFVSDGVFQILAKQEPEQLGARNYSLTYAALTDYGVKPIYCRRSDLIARGITPEQLTVPVTLLENDEASLLLQSFEQVVNF